MKLDKAMGIAGLMCLAACLIGCNGCVTSGGAGDKPVTIKARQDGALVVENQVVKLKNLPAALKAAGARAETPIIVDIPSRNYPKSQMAAIATTLRKAGYLATPTFCPPRTVKSYSTSSPKTTTRK